MTSNDPHTVEGDSRGPSSGISRYEWACLGASILIAAIQSAAGWCFGARSFPLSLLDVVGGVFLPVMGFLCLLPFLVRRLISARAEMLDGHWPVRALLVLLLAGTTLVLGCMASSSLTRFGEQHLLARSGGPEAIAKDSAELLGKVARGEIPAPDGRVSIKRLAEFPALANWKFQVCAVNLDSSSITFILHHHELLTAQIRDGQWLVQRNEFGGPVYWHAEGAFSHEVPAQSEIKPGH